MVRSPSKTAPWGRAAGGVAALFAGALAVSVALPGCAAGPEPGEDAVVRDDEQTVRSRHASLGLPKDDSAQDEHLVVRDEYIASYNRFRNSPNWAAWRVRASDFGPTPRYEGDFLWDPSLPADFTVIRHDDFRHSGYDRGHLVRAEERSSAPDANITTFYLSNVVPQRHGLNTGPWFGFERYVQSLATTHGKELAVYAGGVYRASCRTDRRPEGNLPYADCPTIGATDDPARRVAVPDKLWKIAVHLPKGGSLSSVTKDTRVTAILMDNEEAMYFEGWVDHITTVDAIEALIGYDLLASLPDDVEDALEAHLDRY